MNAALREPAPAKLNVCLFLGAPRERDGRHDLVTVFQPLSLADRVSLEPAPLGATADELSCPGVPGPPDENLAARAVSAFRARARWDGPAIRLRIEKRIPVAAGMGGGSADAGAALRLAARAAGVEDDALLHEVAAGLGADVPGQVHPRRYLATGAGEELRALPDPPPYGVLVLPADAALSTGDVYRQADLMGLPRPREALRDLAAAVAAHGADLPDELVVNDLEAAARALCPAIDDALAAARDAGADRVLVCGSGPTVVGLFDGVDAARAAAVALAGRRPRPLVAEPWRARAGEPVR